MDTLVSLGIISSAWSVYVMFWDKTNRTTVHFTEHSLHADPSLGWWDLPRRCGWRHHVLLAGRYFEAWSKRRSGNALRALADLGAKDVGVMIDTNGFEHRRSVAELDVGDRFIVRPSDQRKRPPQMAKSSLANRRWTAAS